MSSLVLYTELLNQFNSAEKENKCPLRFGDKKQSPKSKQWGAKVMNQNMGNINFQYSEFYPDPMMVPSAPFGVSAPMPGSNESNTRRSLSVTIENQQQEELIASIDRYVLAEGLRNKAEWWPGKSDSVIADGYFKPLLSPPSDTYKRKATLKINIAPDMLPRITCISPNAAGEWVETPGTLDDITPHCRFVPEINIGNIWFSGGKFGGTLNVIAVTIYKTNSTAETRIVPEHGMKIVKSSEATAVPVSASVAASAVPAAPAVVPSVEPTAVATADTVAAVAPKRLREDDDEDSTHNKRQRTETSLPPPPPAPSATSYHDEEDSDCE